MKTVHVCAVLAFARIVCSRPFGGLRYIEGVSEEKAKGAIPAHVDLSPDVRERAADARGRHGRTMLVPGGGENVN